MYEVEMTTAAYGFAGGFARGLLGAIDAAQKAQKNEEKFRFDLGHFATTMLIAGITGGLAGAGGITDPLVVGAGSWANSEITAKVVRLLLDRLAIWRNGIR